MRARIVAPLVAAIIGVAGGAVTAIVTTDATKPETPVEVRDPLGLGVPMVTLACNPNQGVLVLGFGDTAPALLAAKTSNPEGEPSYVDTRESCDTIYGPESRAEPPRYALILGPFDSLTEACEVRMDPRRRGDFITRLRSGNDTTVKCVCVLGDQAGRPELRLGMEPTDQDAVWIRSLQGMLADEDKGKPDGFQKNWVTGEYDQRTADRVAAIQQPSNGRYELGVVDSNTWDLLKTRLCSNYDF